MKNTKLPSIFVALENKKNISVRDSSQSGVYNLWNVSILLHGKEIARIHENVNELLVWNIVQNDRQAFKNPQDALEYIETMLCKPEPLLLRHIDEFMYELRELEFIGEMIDHVGGFVI